MSAVRTPWHVYFAIFLKEHAPPDIQVKFELILTTEPQRGDLLLLRRGDAAHRDGEAQAFRGLWPLLGSETLVEFKSLAWPLRRGDLARLQGYGAQYFSARIEEGPLALADLSLVLIVPRRGQVLDEELARMGWRRVELGSGYARIEGSGYALYLAIIDEVTEAEQDGLLGLFSRKQWTERQIAWWWQHHAGSLEGVNVQDVEGYRQIIREMLASMPVEERLDGLAPEQRLAGLAPEQRLAGLAPEQQLLALSDEILRALPEEYLCTLPAEVASILRARIGRTDGH
jgi:hypothetical protein